MKDDEGNEKEPDNPNDLNKNTNTNTNLIVNVANEDYQKYKVNDVTISSIS
jgi:hypothetical protein